MIKANSPICASENDDCNAIFRFCPDTRKPSVP